MELHHPSLRAALVRSLAPLALMGVMFALSAQPDLSTGLGIWDKVGRKFIHVGEYALLTALWFWTLRAVMRRPFPLAAVITFLYSISDEYHQTFVHGREGTVRDVAIDLAGILLMALLLRYDRRVRSVLETGWNQQ